MPQISRPVSKTWQIAIVIIFVTIIFGLIALFTLLAADVFRIPYLTPVAHVIRTIIEPFTPLIAPLLLGIFLKLWRIEDFPSRKRWMIITAVYSSQHIVRVCGDMGKLWGKGYPDICGLKDCKSEWVQAVLLVVVCVGTGLGWKWDAGYVDMWVDGLRKEGIKEEEAKELQKNDEKMEQGAVDEKRETLAGERFMRKALKKHRKNKKVSTESEEAVAEERSGKE